MLVLKKGSWCADSTASANSGLMPGTWGGGGGGGGGRNQSSARDNV